MSYYARIALFSLLLALATAGLALFGPQGAGITLTAQGPNGALLPSGSCAVWVLRSSGPA